MCEYLCKKLMRRKKHVCFLRFTDLTIFFLLRYFYQNIFEDFCFFPAFFLISIINSIKNLITECIRYSNFQYFVYCLLIAYPPPFLILIVNNRGRGAGRVPFSDAYFRQGLGKFGNTIQDQKRGQERKYLLFPKIDSVPPTNCSLQSILGQVK